MHYVYLIRNERGELYYGFTSDLRRRLREHNEAQTGYTKGHLWTLIYYEAYRAISDARAREKKLKHFGQSLARLKLRVKDSLTGN